MKTITQRTTLFLLILTLLIPSLSACAVLAPPQPEPAAKVGEATVFVEREMLLTAPMEMPAAELLVHSQSKQGLSTGGTDIVNDEAYDAVFYQNYGTNPFLDTEDDHLSTFAMDVDTASYTVARRYLNDGVLPDPDSVRVEEFINYFD